MRVGVTGKSVNGYTTFFKGTFLRAPGAPQALFASEQTVDALAHAAAMDPIAFRMQNIDASDTNGNARWMAVLEAVAQAAKWKARVSAEARPERLLQARRDRSTAAVAVAARRGLIHLP